MHMLAAALLVFVSARAVASRDPYDAVAAYVGVPQDVFYAMALAESGRVVEQQFAPWPWTLNIAGEGRFYPDRDSMFAALMEALQQEQLRIDIGPLQLNWYWQYERIASPWRITDPVASSKLAAVLVQEHYVQTGDWWQAVARYHRPRTTTEQDQQIAQAYRARVQTLYVKQQAKHQSATRDTVQPGEVADAR